MVTLIILLLLLLLALVVLGLATIAWPIILIVAILIAIDSLIFKLLFKRKKK